MRGISIALFSMVVVCLYAAQPADAGERSPAGKMCGAEGPARPSDLACLERALKSVEKDLEDAMARAREAINGGALRGSELKQAGDMFEAAHGHWLDYRNAECEAHERYDKALGGGGPQTRLACIINETVHRQQAMSGHFSSE
ncbi:MAG: lysozyme inhibitor LprI family protein [Hyphomicrobium sp.]